MILRKNQKGEVVKAMAEIFPIVDQCHASLQKVQALQQKIRSSLGVDVEVSVKNKADALLKAAEDKRAQKDWGGAIEAYEQIPVDCNATAILNFRLGYCYERSNNWVKAAEHYQIAESIDKDISFNHLRKRVMAGAKEISEPRSIVREILLNNAEDSGCCFIREKSRRAIIESRIIHGSGGHLGFIIRHRLVYDNTPITSLIQKTLLCPSKYFKDLNDKDPFYDFTREAYFYKQVECATPYVKTPKLYKLNVESDRFSMYLEDVANRSNGRTNHFEFNNATPELLDDLMTAMCHFNFRGRISPEWKQKNLATLRRPWYLKQCLATIETMEKKEALFLNPELLSRLVTKVEGYELHVDHLMRSNDPVLCHWDLNENNILHYKGKPFYFVDFSGPCMGPVGLDLGYFLSRMIEHYLLGDKPIKTRSDKANLVSPVVEKYHYCVDRYVQSIKNHASLLDVPSLMKTVNFFFLSRLIYRYFPILKKRKDDTDNLNEVYTSIAFRLSASLNLRDVKELI